VQAHLRHTDIQTTPYTRLTQTQLKEVVGVFEAPQRWISIPTRRDWNSRGDDPEVSGWLEPTLRSIAHESAQALPGRAVVLNRLADVLFVRVVRAYLLKMSVAGGTSSPSWLRGLTDPQIARALAQIHGAPSRPGRSPSLPHTRPCPARPSPSVSAPSWARRPWAI